MNKIVLLSVFLGSLSLVSLAQAQVITLEQDSVQRATNLTLNDYLREVHEWDFTSTDGYTEIINTGDYGFYGLQPTLYLNDIPVDISYFGWQNVNMLPVSVQKIRRISYSSTPQIYKSANAHAGFLNLQTAKPDTGFNISASGYFANLTEDPGPWVYDSSKVTSNVNRWAEDISADISYSKVNWYMKGHLSYREHQPTTPINYSRLVVYYPVNGLFLVKTKMFNALAEVGYQKKNLNVRARFLRSRNDDYMFYHPFGAEIPFSPFYRQFAVDGNYQLDRWKFSARYITAQKSMNYNLNSRGYDFNWNQHHDKISLAGHFKDEGMEFKLGTLLKFADTQASGIDGYQSNIWSLWGSLKTKLSQNFSVSPSAKVDVSAHGAAPTASLQTHFNLAKGWNLSASGTYAELLAEEQQGGSDWLRRGYAFLDSLNIPYQKILSGKNNKLVKLKLKNTFRLNTGTQFSLSAKYLRHISLNIPWQQFGFSSSYRLPADPGTFEYSSEQGSRLNLHAEFKQAISRKVTHKVGAYGQYTLNGTSRYRDYWEQIPNYKIYYSMGYRPVRDLAVSLKAKYRGITNWKEYAVLDGEQYRSVERDYRYTYGTFHSQTPGYFNIDIRAKKWFWDRRFVTTFAVQNLLNREVRTHPLGVDKALLFDIKVTFHF